MRPAPKTRDFLVAVALAVVSLGAPLDPSEWRYSRPILSAQARPLQVADADGLLARFCQTPVVVLRGIGPTCKTRHLGRAFLEIADYTFHPRTFVLGHFLTANSSDVAVGGSSVEGHPERWGGAPLLTRQGTGWSPVWYRSAIIIDSCEKVALPDGREILLCEDEDGGMGHAIHDLYVVDFEHPSDPRDSLLARADTYKDSCFDQKQLLTDFHWNSDRQSFSVKVETTEWKRLSDEPYCNYLKRPPPSVPLSFTVTSSGLRKAPSAAEH